jgi:hypothetical protein
LEFEIAGIMIKEKEGGRDIWISLDLIFHYTGYTALLHTQQLSAIHHPSSINPVYSAIPAPSTAIVLPHHFHKQLLNTPHCCSY